MSGMDPSMSGARQPGGAQGGFYSGFPGAAGFGGGTGGFEHFHSSIDPEELFKNIFGGFGNFSGFSEDPGFNTGESFDDGRRRTSVERNYSQYTVNLTFREAATGCMKEVHVQISDICPKCRGTKAEPGSKTRSCPQCNGTGMETVSTGPFIMRSTCRKCYGKARIITQRCRECSGEGHVRLKKVIKVQIPAGVEDGEVNRLAVGNKEVFVTFRVSASTQFRRDGADIHSDANISLSQAILGGTIRVPGLTQHHIVDIPAGTQSHTKLRLINKGLKRRHSYGHGDHYIHVNVQIPTRLTLRQKALMLNFAELESSEKVNSSPSTSSASSESGNSVNGLIDILGRGRMALDESGKGTASDDSWVAKIRRALGTAFTSSSTSSEQINENQENDTRHHHRNKKESEGNG